MTSMSVTLQLSALKVIHRHCNAIWRREYARRRAWACRAELDRPALAKLHKRRADDEAALVDSALYLPCAAAFSAVSDLRALGGPAAPAVDVPRGVGVRPGRLAPDAEPALRAYMTKRMEMPFFANARTVLATAHPRLHATAGRPCMWQRNCACMRRPLFTFACKITCPSWKIRRRGEAGPLNLNRYGPALNLNHHGPALNLNRHGP